MTSTQVWVWDWEVLHRSLQQKLENSKGVCEKDESEGINCTGDSCVDSRGRSVWQSLHETSPEVKLSRLVWQITLLEQNNQTFSFDIGIWLLWGANGMSQCGSTCEKHTSCFSKFCGRILHLSCQSSKEYLAWQWWMCSHEAERCLTSLVKGGELGSEREQKQEERGVLSVMLLTLWQFFDWQSGGGAWRKREQRRKSWCNK